MGIFDFNRDDPSGLESDEYLQWLKKFEVKKTTDDCYTPPAVYDAVVEYVDECVLPLSGWRVVRPFYPGGDYQSDCANYCDKTVVIDNPPFSIISRIVDYYIMHGVKFFLFGPALTSLGLLRNRHGLTVVVPYSDVTYQNGANIKTAFITNLTPNVVAKAAPVLSQKIKAAQSASRKKALPRYEFPPNVITVSMLATMANGGVDFEVPANEALFVDTLDSQRPMKKSMFGGGLLVHDHLGLRAQEAKEAAKEAAKDQFTWELSVRERHIVELLGQAACAGEFFARHGSSLGPRELEALGGHPNRIVRGMT